MEQPSVAPVHAAEGVTCLMCAGTGHMGTQFMTYACSSCLGQGRVSREEGEAQVAGEFLRPSPPESVPETIPVRPEWPEGAVSCPSCYGIGRFSIGTSCELCAGAGYLLRAKTPAPSPADSPRP